MSVTTSNSKSNSPQLPFLSGADIRKQFLSFYEARGHRILDSASLVPEDPTVLLTIAGMLPFKPIFLGQRSVEFDRATTSQKCIRTNDIENVGRTARHHTFFEMLGNFSFGDYFKAQAIAWAWELSTEIFKLPADRIVPSIFRDDDEAFAIWRDEIGIPENRIIRMGEADNFWKSGPTGPCGPCSELYYDFHPERGDDTIDLEDDTRFIEYYNLVFMQYNRDAEGNLEPLQAQNIDTGLGLERMAQILQGVPNNYETDLILPIIQAAAQIANLDYHQATDAQKVSLKVIGDHVRAVMHMVADGISASNVGRGYVLRRLIRRVVRHGRLLGIDRPFTTEVAERSIALTEDAYPAVRTRETAIKNELDREETQFLQTLARGEKRLADILAEQPKQVSGKDAFELYDTYGFPLELTQEIAEESGITVDTERFEIEMSQQRERSKAAHETIDLTVQSSLDTLAEQIDSTEFIGYQRLNSQSRVEAILINGESVDLAETGDDVQIVLDQTPFYAESGGQIGDRGYLSGDTVVIRIEDVKKEGAFFVHFGKVERGSLTVDSQVSAQIDRACRRRAQANHTATHLLQAALKSLVNESISQAGSLVDFDRLRFDFHCPQALTPEQLQQVEKQVNSWIAEAHDADVQTMPIAEAKAKGAVAMFGEKYGDEVRVIDYPGVSMELCGGTHVSNTAEIGVFKIISETGIAAGIRRIEAVAGPAVLDYLEVRDRIVRDLSARFKTKPEEISDRVTALQTELKNAQKDLAALKSELALAKSDQLLNKAEAIGGIPIIVANLEAVEADALKTAAERLLQKLGDGAVVLGSVPTEGKVSLVAAFSKPVISKGLQAGKFIGGIAKLTGGGGGGRPHFAQAGGRDATKLPEALEVAKDQIKEILNS
ncbi:alanyl-tRNA synthetase [Synechococcus sp. PCC 7335]|uniref:alanine--tRNA ligase n=1 Tax=Synechococcus sp. (strain ATCC 29403 / PCC 7335) TaxID=91464 RepID=UPI00017ECE12|nr:alanine--tRNA ligase [Synechococcus sp. PCC 7335]EDX87530.1 alanyl-tRNA synthetase [Synechococcus sp. PCC 7335]